MKRTLLLITLLLSACRPILPISAGMSEEFTLEPGQSVNIIDQDLTITLDGVTSDQRCPAKIECAMSGPVSVNVTVQAGSEPPEEFTFQTFTDNDGRVPEVEFQGMQTRMSAWIYTIRIKSVLPFPQRSISEIRDSEYRVSFVVSAK